MIEHGDGAFGALAVFDCYTAICSERHWRITGPIYGNGDHVENRIIALIEKNHRRLRGRLPSGFHTFFTYRRCKRDHVKPLGGGVLSVSARIINIANGVVRRLLKNQVTLHDLLTGFRHDFQFFNGCLFEIGCG